MKLILSNEWLDETLHTLFIDYAFLGVRRGQYAYLTDCTTIPCMKDVWVKDISLKGAVFYVLGVCGIVVGDKMEQNLYNTLINCDLVSCLNENVEDENERDSFETEKKMLNLSDNTVDYICSYHVSHSDRTIMFALAQDIH